MGIPKEIGDDEMKFTETFIKGVWIIEPEPVSDERGFFSRIVCENEFAEHGLPNKWVQQNISFNHKKGTLRGMHYQKGEAAEIKVIRCTCGAIYDAVIDLRKNSLTYGKWTGVELSADNHKMFYIPEGFAHGYLTLTDKAEVTYLVSAFYTPGAEAGIRYDDPSVKIDWPIQPVIVSEKDKNWPFIVK